MEESGRRVEEREDRQRDRESEEEAKREKEREREVERVYCARKGREIEGERDR